MSRSRTRSLALLVATCLIGCADANKPPTSSSTEEATVKGKVVVSGKPATKGQLYFDPSNINRPDAKLRTAEVRPDGTYEVKTLVGMNSINAGNLPNLPKMREGLSTEFALDVQPGENPFDIVLPQPQP